MMAEASEAPSSGAGDNDSYPRKRLRISRACDTCRRRKERCDGTEPACRRCTDYGRTCSYYPSRKRGLAPGYVRSLEILLGLLSCSFPESTDLICSIVHGEPCGIALDLAPPVESLVETWRESTAFEQLHRALASAPPTDENEVYLQDLNQKWTSRFNELPRDHTRTESIPCNTASEVTGHYLQDLTQTQPLPVPRARQLPSPITLPPVNVTSPVLPEDWPRLVNSYLVNTHSWLPIVQKFSLFRCASTVSRFGLSADANGAVDIASGDISSLWAVLALGSYQADLQEAPTVSSRSLSTGLNHSVPMSAHLFASAKSLLPHNQACFQTGHIHASLVLALREIAVEAWTDAWLFVCRAVFMASSIGIIPQTGQDSNETMNDAERRLFMGCFVLDGIVASALSVRPNLHKEDLKRVGGISVDGLEEWEPWGSCWGGSPSCEPSLEPARLLSTLNSLGDLVCLFKSYNQTCDKPELRNKLIQDFMDWQNGLLSSNVPPLPTIPSADHAVPPTMVETHIPPHILHLNILAGTLYSMLGFPASHIDPDHSCPVALRLSTTSALHGILHSMQAVSKKASLQSLGRYIPTLLAALKLLNRDPTSSSSEFLLPLGNGNQNRLRQQSTQLPPLSSTTTCSENLAHGREEDICRPQIRNLNTILTTGLEEFPSSSNEEGAQSAPIHNTDCVNPPTNLPGLADAVETGPTEHDGNFEQLNILEMANWHVLPIYFLRDILYSTFCEHPPVALRFLN
ncbi:hypothetical protein N7541_000802 [Penicillium brevicompactum]|uniref:Zn(2)-C6 fungal-type domain-containing protein n=1 Tax=Penicillium brevicompactum TaxID=5074 RepID=A0A9W9RVC6_PENBR|nr:hypothetical protein N7541_000802 [Penicillium brevicompactum]